MKDNAYNERERISKLIESLHDNSTPENKEIYKHIISEINTKVPIYEPITMEDFMADLMTYGATRKGKVIDETWKPLMYNKNQVLEIIESTTPETVTITEGIREERYTITLGNFKDNYRVLQSVKNKEKIVEILTGRVTVPVD